MGLELPKLFGEDLFRDRLQLFSQLGETQIAVREMPENLHFPFAAEDFDGGLNGASLLPFHMLFRCPHCSPGLPKCAYFPKLPRLCTMAT